MKKQIFLLSLLSLSLFSCGNNKPTDKYTVTEQEMKDAFAMKDVEYLQVSTTTEGLEGVDKKEFTPTSYHYLYYWSEVYIETLVLKDGDNYSKYERSGKEEPFKPAEYEEGDFKTIAWYAESFAPLLKEKEYSDFYYSEERKEYMTYFIDDYVGVNALLFQFLNKKLSKSTDICIKSGDITKTNVTYTYDKIEPPSPTI